MEPNSPHQDPNETTKPSSNQGLVPDKEIEQKTTEDVSNIIETPESPERIYTREEYLHAFLQNITAGSPYYRDTKKANIPGHSTGKLSNDEKRLFKDLDEDDDTYRAPKMPPKTPYIPLVAPYVHEAPSPKNGLFGKLKNTFNQVKKTTGNVIQKYWKGAAAIGTAIVLGVGAGSDSKRKNEPKSENNTILPETRPSFLENKSTISSPEGIIEDKIPQDAPSVPRMITPLEHALQVKENSVMSSLPLAEIVLGKKMHAPQKTSVKEVIVPPITHIPVEVNTPRKDISTIPMYVISDGEKTVYITDRDGDKKLNVDEQRRAYFDAVGGNFKKNTKKMYTLANALSLNTGNITSNNLSTAIEYSDITQGSPIIKTLTIDGLMYTISANTDDALMLGEKKLRGSTDALVKNTQEVSDISKTEIPRAIIVTEAETEIPRAIPVFVTGEGTIIEEGGVLSPKPSRDNILPMFSPSEITMIQRALSYQNAREYVLSNGKYQGSSQMALPSDTKSACAILESWFGIIDAIREVSNDPKQKTLTLNQFYAKYVTIVDSSQKIIPLNLNTFLRKYAGYTDMQVARATGEKIPPLIVDHHPHDKKLTGTFDANGWVEARELIHKGAKSVYGDFPSTEQYNEYFKNNVHLDNHPEIKTYFQFLLHVEKEIREDIQR